MLSPLSFYSLVEGSVAGPTLVVQERRDSWSSCRPGLRNLPATTGKSQHYKVTSETDIENVLDTLDRTAQVAIPPTSAGQKVPVVFHFHGNSQPSLFTSFTPNLLAGGGGHGDTHPFGDFLGDACIIVAPDGYLRRW